MWINQAIGLASIPLAVFALAHALMQRHDAFTAVDKMTKPAWLGITGGSVLVLLLFRGPMSILWIAGMVAALVYLVDVRPKITDVQRGSSW